MNAGLASALAVGAGGCLGSLLRYGVGLLAAPIALRSGFPCGTLAVNLIGCLAIGALAGLADARADFPPVLRAFLLVGLLGGFTTFSSFGYETFALWRGGDALRAAANVALQVALGLLLVRLGYDWAAGRG